MVCIAAGVPTSAGAPPIARERRGLRTRGPARRTGNPRTGTPDRNPRTARRTGNRGPAPDGAQRSNSAFSRRAAMSTPTAAITTK